MQAYLDLGNRILNEGEWVYNDRTGKRCLTVLQHHFDYDVSQGHIYLLTTKQSYWKKAIAEMLGYIRGYTSAEDFRALGTDTWDKNANENQQWLNNPNRTGVDDIGRCYGAQGRDWKAPDGSSIDQLRTVYEHLRAGNDNRILKVCFDNPGERDLACLNACMHTHTFSTIGGKLYLTSDQRSDDVPLGHGFNQVQVCWFLMVMAQITGLKATNARHNIVNAHVYSDQIEPFKVQMQRTPFAPPKLWINPEIKTLEDLETWVTLDDFKIIGYEHHPAIKYNFSV